MNVNKWISENTSAAASVFQVKRYPYNWQAPGKILNGAASFHLIIDGECWLQLEGLQKKVHLMKDDMVFFFRNQPLFFDPLADDIPEMMAERVRQESNGILARGTSMLLGNLLPRNDTTQLLFNLMPDFIILRAEKQTYKRIQLLIELLNIESHIHNFSSDITVGKLTEIFILYLVEHALSNHRLDLNIIRATTAPEMTTLFLAILKSPSSEWSVEKMAKKAGMSRSTFIRRVNALCGGYTPNELLSRLRMSYALNILRKGIPAEMAAKMVGYDTTVGFSRAFTRVMGEGPGSWSQLLLSGY